MNNGGMDLGFGGMNNNGFGGSDPGFGGMNNGAGGFGFGGSDPGFGGANNGGFGFANPFNSNKGSAKQQLIQKLKEMLDILKSFDGGIDLNL